MFEETHLRTIEFTSSYREIIINPPIHNVKSIKVLGVGYSSFSPTLGAILVECPELGRLSSRGGPFDNPIIAVFTTNSLPGYSYEQPELMQHGETIHRLTFRIKTPTGDEETIAGADDFILIIQIKCGRC